MKEPAPYNEVAEALEAVGIDSCEYDHSHETSFVRVKDEDIGQFYGVMRRNDISYEAKRLSDVLVARVETTEADGLRALFG